MVLWWVGNAVFLLVVIPLVALLLHRLLTPVREIRAYADDALEHGVLAIAALDAVDELVETRDRVSLMKAQLADYVGTVGRILS
jgi:hypothetical protein